MIARKSLSTAIGYALILFLMATVTFSQTTTSPTAAAVVLALSGSASVVISRGAAPIVVKRFAWLPTRATLEVGPHSELTLALVNGRRYRLGERTKVTLGVEGLTAKSGAVLELETFPPFPHLAGIATMTQPSHSRAGAVRLRGKDSRNSLHLYPASGASALSESTQLQFSTVAGAHEYRIILQDETGRMILKRQIDSPPVAVPAGVLKSGSRYIWQLEAIGLVGAASQAGAEFTTLTREQAERRAALKIALEKSNDAQSLALLGIIDRQLGLWAEAREEFQAALRQSPSGASDTRQALAEFEKELESVLPDQASVNPSTVKPDRAFSERGLSAESWRNMGNEYLQQGDWSSAEKAYEQALAEAQKQGEQSLEVASCLHWLGTLEFQRGNLAKAESYYRRALCIREKLIPLSLDVGESLDCVGMAVWYRGDVALAERYLLRALAIQNKLAPSGPGVARSLQALGSVAFERGDLLSAEAYFRYALELNEKLAAGSLDVARNLHSLGVVAGSRGDLLSAEALIGKALAIRERLAPASLDRATSLNNLGNVAIEQRDLAKAEDYYQRALALRERLAPESVDTASSLSNLGKIARLRGDTAKAEDYYQRGLALRERLAPSSLDVSRSLYELGSLAAELRHLAQAEIALQQALAIQEKLAPASLDLAATLQELGIVSRLREDFRTAENYLRQALTIREKLAPESTSHAESLHELGLVSKCEGQSSLADQLFNLALGAVESQTARIARTEGLRATFRAGLATYYRDYIDFLLEQKQPERALFVLERSRARSLLSMLAERDLVFAADIASEIREARQNNALAYDRTLAELAKLNSVRDAAQIEQLLARLRALQVQREEIAERVRQASPRLATLQYPQPLDLAGVRQTLDPGTVLLSYSVGSEHTVLFLIQPVKAKPKLCVFILPIGEAELREQVEVFRHLIEEAAEGSRAALAARAHALYDLLLQPAEPAIACSRRILIIPDGPLNILPFAALQRPQGQYVVQWKPVHVAISATVYAELKKMRQRLNRRALELIAFGDPTYPRLNEQEADSIRDLQLRSAARRGFNLTPLPATRYEVTSIANFYPQRSQSYLGAEATEERAKSVGKNVRYLHFATHGLLDERFPLNSALALSLRENPAEGQDNGLLQAWEIFEQMRLDADLVTLSACETGLGQELGGEGLIGLTRAFQYAGVRSVLATLWSVADESTAELMKEFYRQLKRGKSKDEALRTAQLKLLRSPETSHPFYWAPFSLSGDWL